MTEPLPASPDLPAAEIVAPQPAPPLDFAGTCRLPPLPHEPTSADAGSADGPPPDEAPASDPPRDAAALLERLVPHSFADRGMLLADAAAAGRFAREAIRAFHRAAGRPKRSRILYCAGPENAPLPPGFADDAALDTLTTDDPAAILAKVTPQTGAILIAPVRTHDTLELLGGGVLSELREAADEYGIVLAYDDTAGGLCRTGMMWAHEWSGAAPDLLILGDGLAEGVPEGMPEGMPLAAVLTTQRIARAAPAVPPVDPAAVERAHAVLDVILADGFAAAVQERGWALEDRLSLLSFHHRALFPQACGTGLMQGLVCAGPAAPLAEQAAAAGLLTRPMGRVLGLLPPLTVSIEQIDAAAAILTRLAAAAGEAA